MISATAANYRTIFPKLPNLRGSFNCRAISKTLPMGGKKSVQNLFPGTLPTRQSISTRKPSLLLSPESPTKFLSKISNNGKVYLPKLTSCNSHSFSTLFLPCKTKSNVQSTVAHEVRTASKAARSIGIRSGLWHIKTPGKVRVLETVKRFLFYIIYPIMGRIDKLLYYRSVKDLTQREVLGGRIMQHVLTHAPAFCPSHLVRGVARSMNFEYCQEGNNHKMLCQHIENDYVAFHEKSSRYLGCLNPVTMSALRKVMLGDEDYAKRSNYLVQVQPKTNNHLFIPIDFGMAFFNRCEKFYSMNFNEFTRWVTDIPFRKRLYSAIFQPGESLITLTNAMNSNEKSQAAFMALAQMASLKRHQLEKLSDTVENPKLRNDILTQLLKRADKARKLVNEALDSNISVQCLFTQQPAKLQPPSLTNRQSDS